MDDGGAMDCDSVSSWRSWSQLEPVEGELLGVGVAWGNNEVRVVGNVAPDGAAIGLRVKSVQVHPRPPSTTKRAARRHWTGVADIVRYSTVQYSTGGALMALMLLYQQLYYCSTNFSTAYSYPLDLEIKGFSALILDGGWLITCKKLMQIMHILNAETAGKGRAKMGHDGL